MKSMKTIVLGLAATIATASPAMAEITSAIAQQKIRIVRYSDLDLSAEKDRQRLANRIAKAVEKVCSRPLAYTSKEKQDLARCHDQAVARANRKADAAIASYQANKTMAAGRQTAIVGN